MDQGFHREENRWAALLLESNKTSYFLTINLGILFLFSSLYHSVIEKGKRHKWIDTKGMGEFIWGSHCFYVNEYEYRCVQYNEFVGCLMQHIMTNLTIALPRIKEI